MILPITTYLLVIPTVLDDSRPAILSDIVGETTYGVKAAGLVWGAPSNTWDFRFTALFSWLVMQVCYHLDHQGCPHAIVTAATGTRTVALAQNPWSLGRDSENGGA